MNTFAFRFRQSRSCRWRSVSRKVCGVAHAVKTRWFDSENRVAGYAFTNSLGRGVTATLAYDGSRMSGMTFVLPNGGTFSTALTRNAARPDLVTRRAYSANGSSIYSYDTTFDLLGRPVNATDSQSLARSYLYNRRSELAAATIGTNVYEYAYDTIGNRTVASANSVTNTYAANNLNQYTQVDASQLTYDADGNLTQDDRFAYTYDAENRLLSVRPIAQVQGALAVVNAYDHDNRRILKRVERFVDDAWALVETHTFVYDGNNIVLERIADVDGSENVVEYFWGNDLSGTEEGAGGVGGLLAVSIDGMFYFPCCDQNGNAVAYVSESGDIASQYVYDPYGNVIDQYGALADVFDVRFSTRYNDRETGLVSYKRRFYRPEHGRWLNRDPIEEDGGENLYAFCGNNSISSIDKNGCGTWQFGIPSIFGNKPEFTVSYEMDKSECQCCKGVQVLRYVRKFITGGKYGPYTLDGTSDQFESGYPTGYAPDDWPEGPGIGIPFADEPSYRIAWQWDFLFKAKCTAGPWKGEILSTRQKFYKAAGHKQGNEDFEHGFY